MGDTLDKWGYTVGQCTDWVATQIAAAGRTVPLLGNAGDFLSNARKQGLGVSSTPQVGDIAAWNSGAPGASAVGHVAIVTAVTGGNITISEMNGTAGPGKVDSRTISASAPSGYIVPPGGPIPISGSTPGGVFTPGTSGTTAATPVSSTGSPGGLTGFLMSALGLDQVGQLFTRAFLIVGGSIVLILGIYILVKDTEGGQAASKIAVMPAKTAEEVA